MSPSRVYYKIVSPYLMVSVFFIAIGLLLQVLQITLHPYFTLAGIILLVPSYSFRFFGKRYKDWMDYVKMAFVFYWSFNTVLMYLHLSHWSLIVIQLAFFILIGRHEMKVYAKSLTGFSSSAKSSFILFSIAGVVAATGGILQLLGFDWAMYWVAFGFIIGIIWLLKGWMRL